MKQSTRPRSTLDVSDGEGDDLALLSSAEAPVPAPQEESFNAVFGSCKRTGDWYVPDRIDAWSLLGEVVLDFTEADLPAHGQIDLDCNVILGEIVLIVPRDADVDLAGTRAILGDVTVTEGSPRKGRSLVDRLIGDDPELDRLEGADDEEPLRFRVAGSVFLGSVKVKRV